MFGEGGLATFGGSLLSGGRYFRGVSISEVYSSYTANFELHKRSKKSRGRLLENVGGGGCGPLPKTFTLFVTKICDIFPTLSISAGTVARPKHL